MFTDVMASKFLNLTPHSIVIRTNDNEMTIPASGMVVRVSMDDQLVDNIHGVPVISRTTSKVVGIPETDKAVIVSAMVLSAVPNRPNTFAPDTGATAIRNDEGHIEAVTRLVAA
jgi:hypothetical protein